PAVLRRHRRALAAALGHGGRARSGREELRRRREGAPVPMKRKIPSDAFTFYASLGASRSYNAVAEKYGVTKRAVTKLAARERWSERLGQLETEAKDRSDKKIVDELEAMHERHLTIAKTLQFKGLEALRTLEFKTAGEATRS